MRAFDVVREIVRRQKRLSVLTFGIYKVGDFAPLASVVENRARRLRHQFRLHGYWQSILTICWADGSYKKALCKAILAASAHTKSAGIIQTIELKRSEILRGALLKYAKRLRAGESLFVSSKVKLVDGRSVHLPMMDFTCYDTPHDLRKLKLALSALGVGCGVILRSRNSFHYYGFSMLAADRWSVFLGKCLLLMPITDTRYIGHRMIDGACTLRICSGPGGAESPAVASIMRSRTTGGRRRR
jgi:hypothetical protein